MAKARKVPAPPQIAVSDFYYGNQPQRPILGRQARVQPPKPRGIPTLRDTLRTIGETSGYNGPWSKGRSY